jgi:formylmethanofuran dehydrogenase subunit E
MRYRSNDPEADFNRWDAQRAKDEANLPHCEYCGEVIYEKYYNIGGEIICSDCLETHFAHDVDDYLD